MSLAIKYESVEDASMRLRNSVVLYKGLPVFISDVKRGTTKEDPLRVFMQELPLEGAATPPPRRLERALADARGDDENGEAKRKYISSKHFDIAPFRLGYVNCPKLGAFYCTRLPSRQQKQGLSRENFQAFNHVGVPVSFETFCRTKEVCAMVVGDYPSFDVAVKSLKKVKAVAFSRDFCLVPDEVVPGLIFLYHKNVKVGMFHGDNVTLGEKFTCLRESLEEQHVKVGVC